MVNAANNDSGKCPFEEGFYEKVPGMANAATF
jgi:hypothetical protein